ncbi:phosphotransferase family protein [Nonomuraea sp. NPDC050556]|uniref:phosphotransferase family protein n=1 Tax=Nonomuraea sp. NPDC050556 TaxID=3364369 RepID=UPI0037A73B43
MKIDRLRGGTKKGVYRLHLDDGSSAILYRWSPEENYWPEQQEGQDLEAFVSRQALLASLGVRVAKVYYVDRDENAVLAEDVRGEKLEELLGTGAAVPALTRLAEAIGKMHAHRGPVERPCEQIVLERALADLAEAARRVQRIEWAHAHLEARLRELFAAVTPRDEHGYIHGELGPDHVIVNDEGEPVLIDIEGAHFFDVEWEHVFLEMRFHEHYDQLCAPGLDPARLAFYRLAMHLSLVAGPLRLLDGDFPDRAFMLGIAEHHTEQALRYDGHF